MVLTASVRRLAVAMAIAAVSVCGSGAQAPATSSATFGGVINALSEANGYFDTDNLISNEQSYLTVLSDIDQAGLRGGAYVGVGPDQNFSYITAARPAVAFIVDVRRDNLLLHLLFKALFSLARTPTNRASRSVASTVLGNRTWLAMGNDRGVQPSANRVPRRRQASSGACSPSSSYRTC